MNNILTLDYFDILYSDILNGNVDLNRAGLFELMMYVADDAMGKIPWRVVGYIENEDVNGAPHRISVHPVSCEVGCTCWEWKRSGRSPFRHCGHTKVADKRGLIGKPEVDMLRYMEMRQKLRKAGYVHWCGEFVEGLEEAEMRWPNSILRRVGGRWTAFSRNPLRVEGEKENE